MSISLKDTNDWMLEDYNAGLYVATYIGNNGNFPANSTSIIPLQVTFTTPTGTKGHFTFSATVRAGSGDVNTQNNRGVQIIRYNDN